MDRLAKLVTAALLLGAGAAHAGYAQLSPPPGWSAGTAAGNGYMAAANETWVRSTVRTNASLNVGGQLLKVPASLRFAANASSVVAKHSFGNPWIFATLAVGSIAYQWYVDEGFSVVDGKWVKKDKTLCTVAPCIEYRINTVSNGGKDSGWHSSALSAASTWAGMMAFTPSSQAYPAISYSVRSCDETICSFDRISTDQYSGSSSSTLSTATLLKRNTAPVEEVVRPVNETEFIDVLRPKVVPDELPKVLPPIHIPVERPVINPDPSVTPQPLPAPQPASRPLFVPTGDPVPNPQYDPNSSPGPNNQPYVQPGVRVVPSPTASEPWRVDLQPVDRPVASPDPMVEPVSEVDPNSSANDKPSEEQIDFCAKNPDVLACQKLDEPNSEELPASEKPISISPDGGWGADNASCPAPKQITVQGRAIPIPFDLFCTWASGMRPIIIAMAWLSAAFILLGARNES